MKIATLEKLVDSLDKDLSWRKKEFTTWKLSIDSEKQEYKKIILMRASIPILYSHWEGHIKHCALCYLSFIVEQKLTCGNLKDNFQFLMLGAKFGKDTNLKNVAVQKRVHNYLSNISNQKFSLDPKNTIDTKSNLKYDVLENISLQIGISIDEISSKRHFIDGKLLHFRNHIAHGGKLDDEIVQDAYQEIENDLLDIIQTFNDTIVNAAIKESYLC